MRTSRFSVSLILVGCLLVPVAGGDMDAQEPDEEAHASRIPSVLLAGALEFFVPVAGHAYAGDAARGRFPAFVSAIGLATMVVACTMDCGFGDIERDGRGSQHLFVLGFWTLVAGRGWGVVSAMKTAWDADKLAEDRSGVRGAALDLAVTRASRVEMGLVVRF